MDTVRLVLVRHGESRWNASGLIQGHAGVGLSPRGLREAEAVGAFLAREYAGCRLLVRSDLIRVAETAAPAERALGVSARVDRRLREIDVGSWSGKTREQVAVEDPEGLDEWQRGVDTPRGGGERLSELARRVQAGLDDVVDAAVGGGEDTAVVFTHGGPIRVAVEAVLGLRGEQVHLLGPVANGSVTMLEARVEREAGRLLAYNACGHLPAAGTEDSPGPDVAR